MFSFIKGKVCAVAGSIVTIENENGSIGYAVHVAQPLLFAQSSVATVHTYMHWNQEQGPTLFGFISPLEKTVFLLIISCSGIGPKIALALLAELSPAIFLKAVQEGDVKTLSSVSGIGTKKAEQMILQLKDKVSKVIQSDMTLVNDTDGQLLSERNTVVQALQSLNYSKPEIDAALAFVSKETQGKGMVFEEFFRKTLSFLSKKHKTIS